MVIRDEKGFEILQAIKKASRFNQWMFSEIAPYCSGSILEIGSGTGNISFFFAKENYTITLSDIDPGYMNLLHTQFYNYSNVKGILDINLQHPHFIEKYSNLKESFNTILLLNVLEHLENENHAMQNCKYLLKEDGILIILVPAYSWLYSGLDRKLGHHRRYTSKRLGKKLQENGLTPKQGFYFNALGILAWLYGKLFYLSTITGREMKLFNRLTPVAKKIDKLLFKKAGLSVICVAKK